MKQARRVVNIIKTPGVRNTVGIIVLLSLSALAVEAQSSLTDGHTPAGMAAGAPAGSYPLSFDNVNLFNGKLNLQLPLLQIGGRGRGHAAVTLPFESQWQITTVPTCTGCTLTEYAYNSAWYSALLGYGPGFMEGRYSVSDEQLNCGPNISANLPAYTLSRITFVTSDGAEYELRDVQTDGRPALVPIADCTIANPSGYSRGRIFRTADGSAATFISDTDIVDSLSLIAHTLRFYPSGTLILRDGTRYTIWKGLIKRITDRNGNTVSFAYANEDNPIAAHPLIRITDSLNRTVDISYADSSQNDDRITFRGANGVLRTIRVLYSSLDQALRTGFSISTVHNLFPQLNNQDTTPYNVRVVSAVELPDTRRYQFKYNQNGEVARVELPTGAAFEYDYAGLGIPGNDGAVSDSNGVYTMVYRRLLERRVYPDSSGTSPWIERTTYSLASASPNTVALVSHYGPNGSTGTLLASERHYFTGFPLQSLDERPLNYSAWNSGKEYQTEAYNENGTLLRSRTQTWRQRAPMSWSAPFNAPGEPPNDPRITDTTTTLEPAGPNLMSKQNIAYDDSVPYNNPNVVKEYDYGNGTPGSLVRETRTTFITSGNYTDATTGAHLRSLPSQVSTFDAGGTERARSTFEYDNYTSGLTGRANISGHDDAAFSSGYLIRGNVTAQTKFVLPSTPLTTRIQYDIAGNVVSVTDPKNNTTAVDFSDRFGTPDNEARGNTQAPPELAPPGLGSQQTYAFATRVTNALNQTAYTQFDYYIGQPVNGEDINGVISSGKYEDALNRGTQLDVAVGTPLQRRTVFSYADAAHMITTQSDQTTLNDGVLSSTILYDGLGRTRETRTNAPEGTIYSKQEYDALGRVKRVYNPHRSIDDETYGYADTTYDALSRVVRVDTFTGSGASTGAVLSGFSGNATIVTDQSGKTRRSVTDGLGRLIRADEPDSNGNLGAVTAPVQPTSYTYDVLDDLVKVTQGGQTRYFMYDSANRLIRARNPEQVTNSALALTDPLTGNNQWSMKYVYDENSNLQTRTDSRGASGIVTTYGYDLLNRVLSTTYTNDPQNTPAVTYTYDAAGTLYSRGRLTSVNNSVSASDYLEFDALGRIKQNRQTTVVNGSPQSYTMSYGYNLAGEMTTETYPGADGTGHGRVVLTEYDSAGRFAGIKNQAGGYYAGFMASDAVNRIQYAPHGAVSAMKLGNGKWEHTTFNSRLQREQIGLGTSSGDSSTLRLDYGYGVGATNNGNVLSQGILIGTTSINQSYTYDELNRLKTASEASWTQTYAYDRWANRTSLTNTGSQGSLLPTQATPTVDATNNRLIGFTYDSAGNIKVDAAGNSYNYDGENRMTSCAVGGATGSYSYDPEGHRVKKTDATGTTVFVYNAGGQLMAEYATQAAQTSGTSYLTADHLGSTRAVTGQDGTMKARHDYLPFGEEIQAGIGGRTGGLGYVADNVRQKFTLYERDIESGLDFAQARQCSTAQGRFTAADPMFVVHLAQPQSWNRYTYCVNNPVNYRDPTGTVWLTNGGDDPTYLWVDDEEFHRDRRAWGGWNVVPYGTIIHLGHVGRGYEEFGKFVGGDVSLDADRQMTPYYDDPSDPPITISAAPPDDTGPLQITFEFLTGSGPAKRYFGPDAYMTVQMMSSPDVAVHRQRFLQQGGGKYGPTGFRFGLDAEDGPFTAGFNTTRQFVGSFTITIRQEPGGDALFTLVNTTHLRSLLYQIPGIEPVERTTMLPLSSKTQEFWWREKGLIGQ